MTLTILNDLDQGSDEWHEARRGIVTASVVGRLISSAAPHATSVDCPACGASAGGPCLSMAAKKEPTPIKTLHDARAAVASSLPPVYGPSNSDGARTLTTILVAERISGFTDETPMNSHMIRGVECEPVARNLYSTHHAKVTEVGFMRLDESWGTLGYSPDGLVGDDGLIEIKAPTTKGHVTAVLGGDVPAHNMAQCQAGLFVSGREWLDFIPYVGGLPLWVKRVYPDPNWQGAIKAAVSRFEEQAAEMTHAYLTATANLPATERLDRELGLVF